MTDLRAVRHDIITPADGPFTFAVRFRRKDNDGDTTPINMTGATAGLFDTAGNAGTVFTVAVSNSVGTGDLVTLSLTAGQVDTAAGQPQFNQWQLTNSSGVPYLTGSFRFAQPGDGTANQGTAGGVFTLEDTTAVFELSASFDLAIANAYTDTVAATRQPLDATLTEIAATDPAANEYLYWTGAGVQTGSITAAGRDLLDDVNAAAQRATLDVPSTADLAAETTARTAADATLTADVAALDTRVTADETALTTHEGSTTEHGISVFGASLVDDADAAAARTTLGLGTMATETATDYAELSGATFTGAVVLPAASAAGHASRITAYVAATGRIQRDGIEQGDTGWRSLSSWNSAGTVTGWALNATDFTPRAGAAGSVRIRREGSTVSLFITNLQVVTGGNRSIWPDADNRANDLAGMLATMGGADYGGPIRFGGGDVPSPQEIRMYGGDVYMTSVATTIASTGVWFQWSTSQAWPTTLPGSQVTAPATLS